MNKVELFRTKGTIQDQLRFRYGGERNRSPGSFKLVLKPQDQVTRNMFAHALDFKPCLYIVNREPTLELAFDALFGLSSTEAKALYEFDKLQNFQVNTVLSLHARLWQSALPNTFVNSYRLWLEAMRSLQSKQNLTNCRPRTRLFRGKTRHSGL